MDFWKDAIAELGRLGVTQPEIAAFCGCSQSAVSMLANGKIKDPRDSIGQAVRQMLTAKRREAAEKAVASPAPPNGASAERRSLASGNTFPDLDRRAPVEG